MITSCHRMSIFASAIAALTMAGSVAAMSLDDFVPPVDGGTIEPQGAVSSQGEVIVAESMQDGLGYAYQHILDEDGEGIRTVQTKTGFGTIAVSTAHYRRSENLNATLLSKRAAYVRAFADAQSQLVKSFEGFENVCNQAARSNTIAIDSGVEGAANTAVSQSESCAEVAKGVLAGFVTYMVKDDDQANQITVSLASSTKTRSAVSRVGGAVLVSGDPESAFTHVAREISSGVVPPIGAKLIHNPDNGESIVIGFGSAIVRQNRDPSMMNNMRNMARRQSQLRANNALVAFLQGSQVYWEGGFDESQIESSEQFEIPSDSEGNPMDPVIYDATRANFLNTVTQSDEYRSITSGNLPPGVKTKTFPSEDGYWMNTISIYMPSATAAAQQAGQENRSAAGRSGGVRAVGAPAGRSMRLEGGIAPESENPKGPSGRVVQGNDF